MENFQRAGSKSNVQVGKEFEALAREFFAKLEIPLEPDFGISLGVGSVKKTRKFDLGSEEPPVLVECKSHTWTRGDNIPSAKITVWNEAMYYFNIAPAKYRKIFFVLKNYSGKRGLTLANYYLRNYQHLIPCSVEVWEYDLVSCTAERVN